MATREEISAAIRNADKAGDSASVRALGEYLRGMDRQAGIEKQQAADREAFSPTKGMGTGERLLAGAGKAFADIGRGIGQVTGLVSQEAVDEAKKLDAPLMSTGAWRGTSAAISRRPCLRFLSQARPLSPELRLLVVSRGLCSLRPLVIAGLVTLR
jgi:hypothetical protein